MNTSPTATPPAVDLADWVPAASPGRISFHLIHLGTIVGMVWENTNNGQWRWDSGVFGGGEVNTEARAKLTCERIHAGRLHMVEATTKELRDKLTAAEACAAYARAYGLRMWFEEGET